jgi:signal peptidase II
LQFREPIRVIGDFLKFTYTTNKGAAFNIASNATFILTALKLAVATYVIFYMSKVISRKWAIALALLFGGVVGNLWDRAVRPPAMWQGEVVDWIQIPHWPVFNIADSCIVISGILITFLVSTNVRPTHSSERHP